MTDWLWNHRIAPTQLSNRWANARVKLGRKLGVALVRVFVVAFVALLAISVIVTLIDFAA